MLLCMTVTRSISVTVMRWASYLISDFRLVEVTAATPISDGYKTNRTVALRRFDKSLKLTVGDDYGGADIQ